MPEEEQLHAAEPAPKTRPRGARDKSKRLTQLEEFAALYKSCLRK